MREILPNIKRRLTLLLTLLLGRTSYGIAGLSSRATGSGESTMLDNTNGLETQSSATTVNHLTTSSINPNSNCSVKHCLQCDPALPDECVECVYPYLRENGDCRIECSTGFFAVQNMTDNPVDYPRCERDCDALHVSGIPTAPAPYASASSAVYNLLYQSLMPINTTGTIKPTTPVFANLQEGAYLVQKENKQWHFVGLSICPNGTQQCNMLDKISIGGYTDGPALIRPQLCDQFTSCKWKMKQCNCNNASPSPAPCLCSRSDWAEVQLESLDFACSTIPAPLAIYPSPAPSPHVGPNTPSPGPMANNTSLLIPLIIASCILSIGIVTSLISVARRSNDGISKQGAASLSDAKALADFAAIGASDLGKQLLPHSDAGGGDMVSRLEADLKTVEDIGDKPMFKDVRKEWQIPVERLKVDPRSKIGSGGFGVVYRGKFDDINVAVKKLERMELSSKIIREAAVLASLRHPHVVHLYGLSKDQYSIFIVMELCRMSLADLMSRDGVPPSRNLRMRIAMQISDTMSYLHMKGVIHRDLKPENILLHGNMYDVKICDFGLSKMLRDQKSAGGQGESNNSHITLEIGTPAYMAPELFVTDDIDPGPVLSRSVDGRKVDVYSFGIMLYYLYTCQVPYKELNTFQIIFRVKMKGYRPEFPKASSNQLASLVRTCWHSDPIQRHSFAEIHAELERIRANGAWPKLGP